MWTMDHAAKPYVFEEYLPQVSTPWVRLRTGKYTGPLTVPILIGPQRLRLFDSFDIARHMAEVAPESGLVPADRREDMEALNALSHQIIYAGRLLAITPTLTNEGALREALPPLVPDSLRTAATPLARRFYRYLEAKYAQPGASEQELEQSMREGLSTMRERLDGKPYLLDAFSYGDILLATSLQLVRPLSFEHMPLGPETASCWTRRGLAEEFSDLLAWRDGVYEAQRFRTSRPQHGEVTP